MKKILIFIIFLTLSLATMAQTKNPKGITVGKDPDTVLISKILTTDGTDIAFYRGSKLLTPVNPDSVSFESLDFEAVRVLNSLGVTAVIAPLSLELGGGVLTPAMGDGNIYYNLCLVKKVTVLTSFTFVMSTSFVGTGDNYNGIGIYSVSNVDGSLTKLSETANNANIWTAVAGTPTTVNLPTPLTLQPGKYIIASIYNNSAQSTAPSMQGIGTTTWYNVMIPNGVKMSGYSSSSTNNSLPATVTQNLIYPTSNSYVVIGK